MRLQLYKYNTYEFNDVTNYNAFMPGEQPHSFQTGIIAVGRFPIGESYAGKTLKGVTYPVTIQCVASTTATLSTAINNLHLWFDETDQTKRVLIAKDLDDSNKQYYVYCTVTAFRHETPNTVVVSLYTDNPIWEAVTASAYSLGVVSSGDHSAATVGGNRFARPVITLTPTGNHMGATGGTDYAYQKFVPVRNYTDAKLKNYYVNLTDTGLNTQALIAASKMLVTGNDWRVMVDGIEVPRWIGGINTTTSKMWICANWEPRIVLTTSANILNTGTASIQIANTKANQAAIKRLPDNALIMIENELIQLGELLEVNNTILMQLQVEERAARGTTIAAHASGSTIYWVQHDIMMYYGNPTAGAPDIDVNYDNVVAPSFSLTASSNTVRAFTSTFTDIDKVKGDEFSPSVTRTTGRTSEYYTATQGAKANPATAMGISLKAYQAGGRWQSETAIGAWTYYNPCGITGVTSTGYKYRTTSTWANICCLRSSLDGQRNNWTTLWSEATPASASSWTAWTHNSQAVTSTHKYIQFYFDGPQPATANAQASFEETSVTVTLTSANCPQVTILAEVANYPMTATITNAATGESIYVTAAMFLNFPMIIDTNLRTVKLNKASALGSVKFSSIRDEWFRLLPGSNDITFTAVATGHVTLAMSWHDRAMT